MRRYVEAWMCHVTPSTNEDAELDLTLERFFLPSGMLAEQFAAGGPQLRLYEASENQWKDLMNWQHATMYLFFSLAGAISLVVHATEAAPLALDRLALALAFFIEGRGHRCWGWSRALPLSISGTGVQVQWGRWV